jgi:hypothetical protein
VSTPYNDQWVLTRSHQEHQRDTARDAQQSHTLRDRGRAAQEAARFAYQRRARKRPRWIDRDT